MPLDMEKAVNYYIIFNLRKGKGNVRRHTPANAFITFGGHKL